MDLNNLISDIERKANSDGTINYLQLHTGFDFINSIGESILGILLVLMVTLIPLIIVFEIMYINFPIVRDNTNKILYKGNGHVTKALQFTLHDSIKATELANTVQTGKSANSIYLRIKLKWIFVVALSLSLYLGGTGTLIQIISYFLSGIIEAFRNAAI